MFLKSSSQSPGLNNFLYHWLLTSGGFLSNSSFLWECKFWLCHRYSLFHLYLFPASFLARSQGLISSFPICEGAVFWKQKESNVPSISSFLWLLGIFLTSWELSYVLKYFLVICNLNILLICNRFLQRN
jgi:hypothetical protein